MWGNKSLGKGTYGFSKFPYMVEVGAYRRLLCETASQGHRGDGHLVTTPMSNTADALAVSESTQHVQKRNQGSGRCRQKIYAIDKSLQFETYPLGSNILIFHRRSAYTRRRHPVEGPRKLSKLARQASHTIEYEVRGFTGAVPIEGRWQPVDMLLRMRSLRQCVCLLPPCVEFYHSSKSTITLSYILGSVLNT